MCFTAISPQDTSVPLKPNESL